MNKQTPVEAITREIDLHREWIAAAYKHGQENTPQFLLINQLLAFAELALADAKNEAWDDSEPEKYDENDLVATNGSTGRQGNYSSSLPCAPPAPSCTRCCKDEAHHQSNCAAAVDRRGHRLYRLSDLPI